MQEEHGSGDPAPLMIAGYPAVVEEFSHAAVRVFIHRVARLEDHVDRQALLRDDDVRDPPYWAHLWVGARALARRLAESAESSTMAGRRVLDLGCGVGLPGLVAAVLGAEVWFVDHEAAALAFVEQSARRNGFRQIRALRLDFNRESLPVDFDVILGAEIVYDPVSYAPLCEFLVRHLRKDGEIMLTDAFRSDAERFFSDLRGRGFEGRREPRREWEDGRPQGLFLWTFRRSG